jgi:hypothetical protein
MKTYLSEIPLVKASPNELAEIDVLPIIINTCLIDPAPVGSETFDRTRENIILDPDLVSSG